MTCVTVKAASSVCPVSCIFSIALLAGSCRAPLSPSFFFDHSDHCDYKLASMNPDIGGADNESPFYPKTGPLYAFSLPRELLQVIQLRSAFGTSSDVGAENGSTKSEIESSNASAELRSDGSALRCSLCGIASFDSIADQRAHFSSDWHRYNIKRSVSDKSAVKEQEWEAMLDGML